MHQVSVFLPGKKSSFMVGDEIEILDVYRGDDYQLGLIRSSIGRGGSADYLLTKVYPQGQSSIPAGSGKISRLVSTGQGFVATIVKRVIASRKKNRS